MSNPENLIMHTPDLAAEEFAALAALFHHAVTEAVDENDTVIRAIDPDVLAQEINTHVLAGKEERFQFTWPDKRKSVLLTNTPIAAALRPCREESVNFDTTENLYIEGDNLYVLKLLRETYLNRVKMIYIDPPYNTGSDFVYADKWAVDCDQWNYTPNEYVHMGFNLDGFADNIKEDRTAEDLLFQVMLDLGVPLSSKITQGLPAGQAGGAVMEEQNDKRNMLSSKLKKSDMVLIQDAMRLELPEELVDKAVILYENIRNTLITSRKRFTIQ